MSKFYNIDISTNLGGVNASDIKVSSQKSIKTYIDGSLQTVAYIGLDDSISDIIDSATGKQVDISLYAEKLWVQDQGYLTLQTLPSDLGKQSDWTQTDDTQVDFIKNKPTLPDAPGTLNTNISTSQSVSSSEALSSSISLHKISKTGSYNDLLNKPDFATVATSGSYTDLSNKPTIPAAPGILNTNNSTAQTTSVSEALSGSISLHKISKTGSYNDLLNKPNFATVATSGSYTDLSNKPTIPTVNNGTLTIQKNGTSVGTFDANQSGNTTINIVETQELPNVDNNDNGKILVVQNGSWVKGNISMQRYYAGAAVPSESLGTDGDLYLQII